MLNESVCLDYDNDIPIIVAYFVFMSGNIFIIRAERVEAVYVRYPITEEL